MDDLLSSARPRQADSTADCGDGSAHPIRWLKYVKVGSEAEWERLGWKRSRLPEYHEQFSYLYEWQGDGDPVVPAW